MADRLDVTVDELLLGVAPDHVAELRLHAELALATGSPADALGGGSSPRALGSRAHRARRAASQRRLPTGALEATGDLQTAILSA